MTDEGEEPRTTNQEPRTPRRRVFVSGCFDLLHAGHLEFFQQARALGDHLTVSFASAEVLRHHKGRAPALPDGHKRALIEGFACVDAVVVGRGEKLGLDFEEDFLRLGPDILAVTTDDRYGDLKRELCARTGCRYVVLEKTPPRVDPVSSSGLVQVIRAPAEAPLRVDFAGGWLDVPRFARPGTFIVNCAISPCVSLDAWPYERKAGLGGSGAWALLRGEDGVGAELDLGVGWQDPAIIRETGLCVWRSGALPVLDFKRNGDLLAGRLALHYTGRAHDTPGAADLGRDYDAIAAAGGKARRAVLGADRNLLAEATDASYQIQLAEGMDPLPGADGALARKYCGGGWGGYALYLFEDPAQRDAFAADPKNQARTVEPFTR